MSNNFIITGCDTDSISFNKRDGSEFSFEEQNALIKDINSLLPSRIKFVHDGYFQKMIVLKTKNYILYDGEKLKIKGSALRDSKKPQALKDLQNEIIWSMINGTNNYTEIYSKYIREAMDVVDIKRWSSKKTITSTVMTSERTNETKIKDAVALSDYKESDKVFLFFKSDDSLCLAESFNGDYNKDRLLKQVFMAVQVFESVLPIKDMFINYSLKRNKSLLEVL